MQTWYSRYCFFQRNNAFKGEFEKFCKEFGIENIYSQAGRHDTNGLMERVNRTVEETLRHNMNYDRDNWRDGLPSIQMAINSAVAKSFKFSPFYLDAAREPVFPFERILSRK